MATFEATGEQIEQVREIAELNSISETESLVSALTVEQWTRTLDDIDQWETSVRDDDVNIVNGLLGSNISADATRTRLTNRVRRRLGLLPAGAETKSMSSGTTSVPIEFSW